jgi:hypothetical protein
MSRRRVVSIIVPIEEATGELAHLIEDVVSGDRHR